MSLAGYPSPADCSTGLNVAMVAGEASGDLLSGLLLDALQARWPGLQAMGIGGVEMAKRGFQAWWPSEKLAVRGYVEVLRSYCEIVGIRKQLQQCLLERPPALFIGVDAPDFNLDLEYQLKSRGIKTVHFVSPSIWAWRAERIAKIRRSVDHVLCIFPFEPALLQQHGISASYVGHPLANVIPLEPDQAAARQALGLGLADQVVALLPGSRQSEISYLGERFFTAAVLLKKQRPDIKLVVPAVPWLRNQIEQAALKSGANQLLQIVSGQSHQVLAACDVCLIASGTATLEAALFKRPMVIAYNMNWLSWQIMRRKKLQPWIGLPNILCQDFVVPELLQQDASPQALSRAVLDWFDLPEKMTTLRQRFTALHHELKRDTAQLSCDAIEKILQA